jgi:hypothetical protein
MGFWGFVQKPLAEASGVTPAITNWAFDRIRRW